MSEDKETYKKEPEAKNTKTTGISDELESRLYNWKFYSAKSYIDEDTDKDAAEYVRDLSTLMGNCGWGVEGALGPVVAMAVQYLINKYGSASED